MREDGMVGSPDSGVRGMRSSPVGEESAWDAFLAEYPEATFYHTRIWARIVARAFPHVEDRSRWVHFGEQRVALPLFGWRRLGGILTTLQSTFPFLYGGPIPCRLGGRDLLPAILRDLARGGRSLIMVSNPFGQVGAGREAIPDSSDPAAAGRGPALPRRTEDRLDFTQVLRLPSRFEEYWEDVLTTSKRNDVRRLAKKGVLIRCGGTADEIAAVCRFYSDSFARWGARPGFVYPEEMYRAMIELGGEQIRLYLAEYQERIIGGAFVVRWNNHAHYHAGYFDHEARSLRPNVLLQERIIRDAIADGYHDYDFLPSGGNTGVEAFKEGFGGLHVPIHRYQYRAPLHRLLGVLRGGGRSAGAPPISPEGS
jgi:hypothetical protein